MALTCICRDVLICPNTCPSYMLSHTHRTVHHKTLYWHSDGGRSVTHLLSICEDTWPAHTSHCHPHPGIKFYFHSHISRASIPAWKIVINDQGEEQCGCFTRKRAGKSEDTASPSHEDVLMHTEPQETANKLCFILMELWARVSWAVRYPEQSMPAGLSVFTVNQWPLCVQLT